MIEYSVGRLALGLRKKREGQVAEERKKREGEVLESGGGKRGRDQNHKRRLIEKWKI